MTLAHGAVPPLTGERTWPGVPQENYWFRRHQAAYRWAAARIGRGREGPVLDAGSGEGYGAAELQHRCGSQVTGFDLDAATLEHARAAYPHLAWVRGNLVTLPFGERAFRAAVSLQVVEHIWDPIAYLSELSRCTSGPVVVSTPNRPVHSPHLPPGAKPDNVFHVREFDATELRTLLQRADPDRRIAMFGLAHGHRIADYERDHGPLPRALLSDATAEAQAAAEFAMTVTAEDFSIAALHAPESDSPVQDLIALW